MGNLRELTFDITADDLVDRLARAIKQALNNNQRQAVISDLCLLAFRDFNRAPWATAFLRVFDTLPEPERQAIATDIVGQIPHGDSPAGAALLAIAAAERLPWLRTDLDRVLDNTDNPAVE